jgi:hypothetical protein
VRSAALECVQLAAGFSGGSLLPAPGVRTLSHGLLIRPRGVCLSALAPLGRVQFIKAPFVRLRLALALLGRGWLASGAFTSRCETGEGV